jgi:hypothetical protein
VTPAHIITWGGCCATASKKYGFCLAQIQTIQVLALRYIVHSSVNRTLQRDVSVGKVCNKVAHACYCTFMSWSLNLLIAFLPHQMLHGDSWNLEFCRSFLCGFSGRLKNWLLQTSTDICICIFLSSSILFCI